MATLGPFAEAARTYKNPRRVHQPKSTGRARDCPGKMIPIHMLKSHDGLNTMISSDAPNEFRMGGVPVIDRRLGYPAAFTSPHRGAPELPEPRKAPGEWAGSQNAVSALAPVEFRLRNRVPVMQRDGRGAKVRVRQSAEYSVFEAVRTAEDAVARTVQRPPTIAGWARDRNKVASPDAPLWMRVTNRRHVSVGKPSELDLARPSPAERQLRDWTAAVVGVVPERPTPARPCTMPKAVEASKPRVRGRRHLSAPPPPSDGAAHTSYVAERNSAAVVRLQQGAPSPNTPSWFAHPADPPRR